MPRQLLVASVLLSCCLSAQATSVTAGMTGAWFDPARNGQGIQVQVVGTERKEVLLYWYTFDASGNPLWLYAQAPITEDTVRLSAFEVRGPSFVQNAAPVTLRRFGELELSFDSCNSGRMRYSTTLGTGEIQLSRLSQTFGAACTGTLIDDHPSQNAPELTQSLVSGGLNVSTHYREEPNRLRYNVEIQGAANQAGRRYALWVGGIKRAEFTLLSNVSGSRAELEFASPVEAGKLPLTFDPRGQAVEIRDSSGVPIGGGSAGTSAPPFGNSEQIVDLNFASSFPLGSGDAKLKRQPSKVSFSVEIEDVPVGAYGLLVAGVQRGSILVTFQNGRAKGELEFSTPQDAGKPRLDFDPRGQLVQVLNGNTVIASITFPN